MYEKIMKVNLGYVSLNLEMRFLYISKTVLNTCLNVFESQISKICMYKSGLMAKDL